MSREHYSSRFSDHFANREQGSSARAAMITRVHETSVSLAVPADISPVNIGCSEKWKVLKILGPLAVPFLLMACSSASSQPQARQIESSPTVSIPTPAAEATATPPPCNPDEFAKTQGIPTPSPLGGESNDPLIALVAEIRRKIDNCQSLTPAEVAAIRDLNKKYNQSEPVKVPPSPEPEFSPRVISKETANFVSLSPSEVQKLENEALSQGKVRLPVPDWVRQEGVSVRFEKHQYQLKAGPQETTIALISVRPNQPFKMPSLTVGRVTSVSESYGDSPVSRIIGVATIDGETTTLHYYAPFGATKVYVKKGDNLTVGDKLFETTYEPGSSGQTAFAASLPPGLEEKVDPLIVIDALKAGAEVLMAQLDVVSVSVAP